jgi:ABC-2 type transport system permease protein
MSGLARQFKRSLVIAEKNIKIYYLKGPVIIFGLVFPLFLALAYIIGRNISLKEFLPGLIGMTAFFTATSVGPSIVPWETRSKTLERLLCCPVAMSAIIVGDMFSSFIFGSIISIIPLALTLFLGIQPLNFMMLLLGLIIANLCFAALSVLLSAYPPTDVPATSMMLSSLVKFPLVFISGVFVPVEQLPPWGVAIASISPLTYFTDMVRQLFLNRGFYPPVLDFLALVAFTFAAIKLHEKTLAKRLS